jgi:hypothetical protein
VEEVGVVVNEDERGGKKKRNRKFGNVFMLTGAVLQD